jgi:hypothetical protein
MNGLEGTNTSWIGLMATVLVLIVVWVALIAGLCLIVRGRRQAEEQALSRILRLIDANMSCRGCHYLDRQVVHWLAESGAEQMETKGRPSSGDPAREHTQGGE